MNVSAPDRRYAFYIIGELILAAKIISNGKAPDPGGNEVVKAVALSVPSRFVDTINKSINKEVYPDRRKAAKLVLLHKSGRSPKHTLPSFMYARWLRQAIQKNYRS